MSSFIRLVIWGILWLPFWCVIEVFRFIHHRPRMDNCLSWSARRWNKEGGYLVIRWCRSSRHEWMRWPHFLWLPENANTDQMKHFMPRVDNTDKHLLPDLWFEGKIQTGDKEDEIEN